MEHVHVNKVQERCRVCGRLLVAPRDKNARQSYQYTEFSADLHSVFGIDTHNDAVNIHPLKFCYRCKTSYGWKHSSTMPALSLH